MHDAWADLRIAESHIVAGNLELAREASHPARTHGQEQGPEYSSRLHLVERIVRYDDFGSDMADLLFAEIFSLNLPPQVRFVGLMAIANCADSVGDSSAEEFRMKAALVPGVEDHAQLVAFICAAATLRDDAARSLMFSVALTMPGAEDMRGDLERDQARALMGIDAEAAYRILKDRPQDIRLIEQTNTLIRRLKFAEARELLLGCEPRLVDRIRWFMLLAQTYAWDGMYEKEWECLTNIQQFDTPESDMYAYAESRLKAIDLGTPELQGGSDFVNLYIAGGRLLQIFQFIDTGKEFLRAGNLEHSEVCSRNALSLGFQYVAGKAAAVDFRITVLLAKGDYEGVRELASQCLEEPDLSLDLWAVAQKGMGIALVMQDQREKGEECLLSVAERDEVSELFSVHAVLFLFSLGALDGNQDQALKLAERYLDSGQIPPEDVARVHAALAMYWVRKEQFEKATVLIRKGLEVSGPIPEFAEALCVVGTAQSSLDVLQEGVLMGERVGFIRAGFRDFAMSEFVRLSRNQG